MRNLTKTLAVVSLLMPAGAYPLGIGEIKLHSALNQNLNAEIGLVVSAGEDVADIKVSLAPPAKFDEAGVAWSYFLSKIKFEPVVKSNGSVVIKLSSREALKEPFLNFLLQVSWPKGNLYREFTVLVDPPAVYKQATIPLESDQEIDEVAEPAVATQRQAVDSRFESNQVSIEESESNVVEQKHSVARPRSSQEAVTGASGGYVSTRKNDTLWKVAERPSRQENVSVEQMMIAIYKENPHAFYKKNVNALLAGERLKIPDRNVALRLSRKQALVEFNRQRQQWENHTAPQGSGSQYAEDDEADKQLTLVAPTEGNVDENAVVTPGDDKQKIAQPADKSGATTLEIQAIQNKVAELEKQLAVMQQLLALKDQQLATLQNQTPAAKASEQEKPQAAATDGATAPAEQQPVAPSAEQQPPAPDLTKPAQPAIEQPVLAQPQQPVEPSVEQPVVPEVEPPKPQTLPSETQPEAQQPAVQPSVEQPKVKPVAPAKVESGTDYYYPIVAALGTGALSLLGWLWWRKRKTEEETNADSMFATSSVIVVPEADDNLVQAAKSNTLFENDNLADSTFLSDFAPSDFDVFDTAHGEIDPISEADVYLAYGRYQQAEELIRQAIKDQPNDDECKLKLLEIFYANENKSAFEAYAKELVDAGKNLEPVFWGKVTDMGKDISPGSALFTLAAAGAGKSSEGSIAEMTTSHNELETEQGYIDDLDLDEDLLAFEEGVEIDEVDSLEIKSGAEKTSLDFEKSSTQDEAKVNESIEFDLTAIATSAKNVKQNPEKTELESDIETVDFDFGLDTKPSVVKPAAKAVDDGSSIDFTASNISSLKQESFDNDFDFDFNFELDNSEIASDLEANVGEGFEVADLTDLEELETKLDLAKAYVDMGDIGAAKEIANEVLLKGSAEQKKLAQLLLDDLG